MDLGRRRALAARARAQGGLLTAADFGAVGLDESTLRTEVRHGRLTLILPGVGAPAGLPLDRGVRTRAAALWLPPDGGLSHLSAAEQSGIHVPSFDDVWVTVPWARPQRSRRGLVVIRTRHIPPQWRVRDGLRWTAPARTLVDLAQVLSAKQLDAALLSAVRRRLTTAALVDAAAEGLAGRAGLHLLRQTTRRCSPERESQLEDLLDADIRAVTDQIVVRQLTVTCADGRTVRGDVAIPALRLIFEADGLLFHSTDAQLMGDQRRDRALLITGWQVVRFREGPLDDRARVRAEIDAIIRRRQRDVA